MGGVNIGLMIRLGGLTEEKLAFFMSTVRSLHDIRISKLSYSAGYKYAHTIPSTVEMTFNSHNGSYQITAQITCTISKFIDDILYTLKIIDVHS